MCVCACVCSHCLYQNSYYCSDLSQANTEKNNNEKSRIDYYKPLFYDLNFKQPIHTMLSIMDTGVRGNINYLTHDENVLLLGINEACPPTVG